VKQDIKDYEQGTNENIAQQNTKKKLLKEI
jgi:hypothetical protein